MSIDEFTRATHLCAGQSLSRRVTAKQAGSVSAWERGMSWIGAIAGGGT